MKHFIFALTALTMLSCSQEAPRNVAELCDDDPSTSYAMPASRPCRVVFDGFDTPMRSYRVYSSGEVPAADPAGWVLSGSHDGRKWVELDRREGCVFCSRFQEITGRIAEPSNYTAYKIEFLPREEADTVAVGDVRFYERDREEAWSGFVYPAVDFEVLDPQTEGAAIYATLVQDPGAYVRYHTRKVAEILFYSAARLPVRAERDWKLFNQQGVLGLHRGSCRRRARRGRAVRHCGAPQTGRALARRL